MNLLFAQYVALKDPREAEEHEYVDERSAIYGAIYSVPTDGDEDQFGKEIISAISKIEEMCTPKFRRG